MYPQPMSLSNNDVLIGGNFGNFGIIPNSVSTAPYIPTKQTASYNIPLVGQGTYTDYKTNKHSYVGWYIFFFVIFLVIIIVLVVMLSTSHEEYKSNVSSREQGFTYSLNADMSSTVTRKGFVNDDECQNNPHVALNGPKRCICETGWTGQYCAKLDTVYLNTLNEGVEYNFLGMSWITIPEDTHFIEDTDATSSAISNYIQAHSDVKYILVNHTDSKVYFITVDLIPSLETPNIYSTGPFLYQVIQM